MTPREILTEAKKELESLIQHNIENFYETTGFMPCSVEIQMMSTPLYNDMDLCVVGDIIVKIKL